MSEADSRIALIGIIVSSHESVEQLNALLSEYGSYIVGRMGIPYREKNISIISIAMDEPNRMDRFDQWPYPKACRVSI